LYPALHFIFFFFSDKFSMAYRRSKGNIRKAPRRRRRAVRRAPARRSMTVYTRRRTTRRRVADPCKCPGELTPGDKFVMIQSDPFDTKYFGAKIPDSSTIPSIATPLQWNQSLSTPSVNPSFAHAWAFQPNVSQSYFYATGTSATAWTWSATDSGDYPNRNTFLAQFEATRPTAHAIRLSCPYAPTSTTGFVHIAIATETTYNSAGSAVAPVTQLAPNLSDLSNYTFYKRVTLASLTQSPITLINKWTDETAFRYSAPNISQAGSAGNPLTFHIPNSWGMLVVAVEGVSSSTTPAVITPLQAEIAFHTENIPNRTSTLIGSTAAAYSSGVLNAVSQAVANTDFAHTEDQQESTIRSYADEVANAMGTSTSELQGVAFDMAKGLGRMAMRYAAGGVLRYARGIGGVNNDPNRLAIMN